MLCDNLEEWAGLEGGREVQDGEDICVFRVDPHCYREKAMAPHSSTVA